MKERMTKRTFNCECNKVLKDGEGERCGECGAVYDLDDYKKAFRALCLEYCKVEPEAGYFNMCYVCSTEELGCEEYYLGRAAKGDQP